MTDWLGMRWHSKWNYVYAYSAHDEALSLTPDLDHWSPDLADRADAWACAREDEELQAVYEEQLADYQRQMEYAYYMEEARRRAQEAELVVVRPREPPGGAVGLPARR